MEDLLQDVRYAVRSMRRSPVFTLAAVLTLALGIGANAAIFTVVDAVLLRPMPYPAADRLAAIWGTSKTLPQALIAIPDIDDWRARNHAFDDIGMIRQQSVNLTGGDHPDRLFGAFVTANTLRILGARPALGRLLRPEESERGAPDRVAVLSHAAWMTRFGGDTGIVGKSITLNGTPHVVVGVTASDFVDPYGVTEVWLAMASAPPSWFARGAMNVWAIGRVRAGESFAEAQRDLSAVAAQVAAEQPAADAGFGVAVTPLRESIVGGTGEVLWTVLGFVAVVLLIACANVANLQLARATARRREFSVRAALGARRGRLVRQLFTESVILSAAGGVLGLGFAVWSTRALVTAMPGGMPSFGSVAADGRVLAFCAAIVIGSGLLFGAVPAMNAARTDLNRSLASRSGDAHVAGRVDVRDFFVAAQLALCVVLLVGAGLLGRSLVALERVRPGFDTHGLLTAQLRLPPAKYRTPEAIAQFMSRAIDEVRAAPGVRKAALVRSMPLTGNFGFISYRTAGASVAAAKPPATQQNSVGDGYFATMRIPIAAGRDFGPDDRATSQPVVIVNGEFARREWPGESPLGKRVTIVGPPAMDATVVGLVGDVTQRTLGDPPVPQLYQPVSQDGGTFTSFVVRTNGAPGAIAGAVRSAIARVDADQPVWGIRPVDSYVSQNLATPRFALLSTGAFALLALLLAAVGVYGVMSYVLEQRMREVGIRMALGATRRQIVGLVLERGARTLAAALAIGIVGAYAAARLLEGQLFGVGPADPITYLAVPGALAAIALLASWLPARRAASVDPVVVLRNE